MKDYLCILLRNQFTFWYRFGYTQLHLTQMIPFNGKVSSKEQSIIFNELLNMPFEYDEEYLIFHINTSSKSKKQNVEIQQIKSVYPLTENARRSISNKIDPRIHLSSPFFINSDIDRLELELDKKEREKAISILWSLCNITEDYRPYLDKLGLTQLDDAIRKRFLGFKPKEIHQGNYLDYLYTYDRTAYYQPTKIGYFQDAIAILTYYIFKKRIESKDRELPEQLIEDTRIFQSLVMLPEENWGSFKNIFEFVNTQEDYIKNSKINGLDFYIITPLFLMLKDEMIKNNNDLSKTLLLDESKLERFKEYKDNFYYAIIIFSYFFGYKYIYDAYYDRLDLSIFRKEGDLKHFTNPVLEHKENFLEEGGHNKRAMNIQEELEKRKCEGFKENLSDDKLKQICSKDSITKKKSKEYICMQQDLEF